MRILILIENNIFKQWHLNCLKIILSQKKNKVIIGNFNYKKKYNTKNFLYYFLKYFNAPYTEKNCYGKIKNEFKVYNLDIKKKNKFFILDQSFKKFCKEKKIDLILRFGLGIIKSNIKIPILSFHHGDPRRYRGRPVGFYEILFGENYVGQIVQVLGSKLDAGKILAYGESKLVSFSYKKTLENVYSNSHILLLKAIQNLKENKFKKFNKQGKIYFVPGNFVVINFILKLLIYLISNLRKKIFYLKRWKIITINYKKNFQLHFLKKLLKKKNEIKIDSNFNFIADPFYYGKNLIFEITQKFSQKGKIGIKNNNEIKILHGTSQHISFPSHVYLKKEKKNLFFPEIASWSYPKLFEIKKNKIEEFKEIKFLNNVKLIDPILFYKDKYYFIFGNNKNFPNILNLWFSRSLDLPFKYHPSSPLLISPYGSRMAGNIFSIKNSLYRVGQNNSLDYGNGLAFYKIKKITNKIYEEKFVSKFNYNNYKGPHTFSINKDIKQIAMDYYENEFNPLSLITKLNSK